MILKEGKEINNQILIIEGKKYLKNFNALAV
jgi:hypothetical protein